MRRFAATSSAASSRLPSSVRSSTTEELGKAMPLATMPLLPNRSNAPTYFP